MLTVMLGLAVVFGGFISGLIMASSDTSVRTTSERVGCAALYAAICAASVVLGYVLLCALKHPS